jgi:hypothetical protein
VLLVHCHLEGISMTRWPNIVFSTYLGSLIMYISRHLEINNSSDLAKYSWIKYICRLWIEWYYSRRALSESKLSTQHCPRTTRNLQTSGIIKCEHYNRGLCSFIDCGSVDLGTYVIWGNIVTEETMCCHVTEVAQLVTYIYLENDIVYTILQHIAFLRCAEPLISLLG